MALFFSLPQLGHSVMQLQLVCRNCTSEFCGSLFLFLSLLRAKLDCFNFRPHGLISITAASATSADGVGAIGIGGSQ